MAMDASVDSDWGADVETRRSVTGFVFTANGSPIYWRSKRHTIVALSSGEAEYVALSSFARKANWLRKLFFEMNTQSPWQDNIKIPPMPIHVDSTTAISIASRDSSTPRTKHIDLKYHHVCDMVQRGIIIFKHVPSWEQMADGFTKIATESILERMVERMVERLGLNLHV